MRHVMSLFKFSFDKIVNGTKRIDIRLYEPECQKVRINDVIEYVCADNEEKLYCLVRGILIFERFDDLIELFPAKMFGYDGKEEIKVRVKRAYTFEEQLTKHVVGFIIMPLQLSELEKEHGDEYLPKERSETLDLKNSAQKDYSKVKISRGGDVWVPISQFPINDELDNDEEKSKAAEMMRMKKIEGRDNER